MRGHSDYEFFRFPPFPPHFGPWDSGVGFFGGGRGRTDFDRPGCTPYGTPGFHGYGPYHRLHHDRHRSKSPSPREDVCQERPNPPEHNHHGRHEPYGPPGRHGSPGCHHRRYVEDHHGHSENERWHRGHGMRDHSPCNGPPRKGPHHHHWSFHDHRGFGSRFCPRDFYSSNCRGYCGPRFGHRRPIPYERPDGRTDLKGCEDCRGEVCCAVNEESRGGKKKNERCGKKKNESCCNKNNDQDATGDTVLMQRIVVERAPTRPQSV